MRVLIVFGSSVGGAVDIAETMAVALTDRGISADVRPAHAAPDDLGPYDAAIVGSGLEAARWANEGCRFVERHRNALRQRSVWFFSSGPLHESAARTEIDRVASVERLARSVQAREHRVFGGGVDRGHAHGLIARLKARGRACDVRDERQAVEWANQIAGYLQSRARHPSCAEI
jgi:menaquinone-dependent protoporphyrinogen oxidase